MLCTTVNLPLPIMENKRNTLWICVVSAALWWPPWGNTVSSNNSQAGLASSTLPAMLGISQMRKLRHRLSNLSKVAGQVSSQKETCLRARSQSGAGGVVNKGQEVQNQRKFEVTIQLGKLRSRVGLGSALPTKGCTSELRLDGALPAHPRFQTPAPRPTHHHTLNPAEAHGLPGALLHAGARLVLHEPVRHLVAGPAVKGQGVQVAAFLLGARGPRRVRQAGLLALRPLQASLPGSTPSKPLP